MIYPSDFEARIGFDRIRAMIDALCTTASGKEIVEQVTFMTDFGSISQCLAQTDEMRAILVMESTFPTSGYTDINHFLGKIGVIGTFLETHEIADLKRALELLSSLTRFFAETELYPTLKQLTEPIGGFPEIIIEIDRILDKFGKIKDNASPDLQQIRRSLSEKSGQISRRLAQIMRQAQADGIVDADASISIREGRTVIPIAAGNKRKIKGLIHDESATGKTAFIEPIEVVELNNEVRELEYAERREIVKILTSFTDNIRPHSDDLKIAGGYIATIDFIKAKGKLALESDACKPILVEYPHLQIIKGRHPLLEKALKKEHKKIVPLDIKLDAKKHILLISGPNAGGKSVCLKTVGLLQYMMQCGIPIPASANSEMGIFRSIFIDIGDQQSIENDLSTYSSHLTNMKTMLRHADKESLVLIDEFGTGTEPIMGGAIAEAILEKIEAAGVFGVITTHYSNLKYYASSATGIINGAMTFDVQKIEPLFQLEIGKPGSSFAVEIARKIGLPEQIISVAAEKAGSDHVNIERQLREVARDKRYWENKRDKIRIAEKRIDETAEKYQSELEEISNQRAILIKKAKTEAANIVAEANRKIENAIREIRETQANKERTKAVRESIEKFKQDVVAADSDDMIARKMEQLREKEKRRAERKKERNTENKSGQQPELDSIKPSISVGSKVRIGGQESVGEVMAIAGKRATVAFGHIFSTVEMAKLEAASSGEAKKNVRKSNASPLNYDTAKRRLDFHTQLDIRGMRANDALAALQTFVDEAIMLGFNQVSILHGKGTGALKQEIRNYLNSQQIVASAKDEHEEFGGAGITIVKFDF